MTIPPSGWPACYKAVYWWDGEYDNNCILREDHPPNIHYDGMSWYDDDMGEIGVSSDIDMYESDLAYIKSVYGPPKGLLVI